jgi:hypothetical protein
MDRFRDFRTIFKTEFQIVTQRSIGWFAALARRFKHIVGPNVSFRDRGIALRCRDGNDPFRTYLRRSGRVRWYHQPFGNGFGRGGRFPANKTFDFQPNRTLVIAMVMPDAGKILSVFLGDGEHRAVGQMIFR